MVSRSLSASPAACSVEICSTCEWRLVAVASVSLLPLATHECWDIWVSRLRARLPLREWRRALVCAHIEVVQIVVTRIIGSLLRTVIVRNCCLRVATHVCCALHNHAKFGDRSRVNLGGLTSRVRSSRVRRFLRLKKLSMSPCEFLSAFSCT